MIKLKDILFEVGEGSAKPYSISKSHKSAMIYGLKGIHFDYRWKTKSGYEYSLDIQPIAPDLVDPYDGIQDDDKGNYVVAFGPMKMGKQIYGIDGRPVGTPQKDMDTETQTNRGELFSIMATIVDAFKDFIKKEYTSYEDPDDAWGLKSVEYEGAKAEDAKSNQRNKLYAAYIKKHLPNATIRNIHGDKMEILFK